MPISLRFILGIGVSNIGTLNPSACHIGKESNIEFRDTVSMVETGDKPDLAPRIYRSLIMQHPTVFRSNTDLAHHPAMRNGNSGGSWYHQQIQTDLTASDLAESQQDAQSLDVKRSQGSAVADAKPRVLNQDVTIALLLVIGAILTTLHMAQLVQSIEAYTYDTAQQHQSF